MADLVRNVGGEHVEVTALMAPGVDPHLYKPTPADMRRLARADIVFYNGLHLEGRLSDLLARLDRWKPTVAVAEALLGPAEGSVKATDLRYHRSENTRSRHLDDEELIAPNRTATRLIGQHGAYDPHVWMDVSLWSECVPTVAAALARIDPQHADDYHRRAQELRRTLCELHLRCAERLSRIPVDRRVLVTAHDAFGYFGAAYGVEVRALQGMSTVAEADLAGVNQIIDLLVERGVKAVFVESSVPVKNVRALIEGCAARGHVIQIGGELYSDSLGPPGSSAETYIGMIEHNVRTIVAALE